MANAIHATDTPRVSLRHPTDSAELRWYFSHGGLAVFQTSTFGSQLERMRMFAYGGRTCEPCAGLGFVPSKPDVWRAATERERELLSFVGINADELVPPLADQVCKPCGGRGWQPSQSRTNARAPLTARPRGSSVKGKPGGVDVGEVSLARLGAVTARLSRISAEHRLILDAFYSPSGGALVALYEVTPAGKTLLRRNSQRLSPRQFFENESAAQADKHDRQRGALLETAETQAAEIHREACAAWEATRHREARDVRALALAMLGDES
jgi:hypothetical protein